ncbi:protein containg FOG: TPR repeat [Longilinea arvoryzae]|uniref:Protein containg FOG: TPR repeat n=1 Tax=Longilinea arvoryzae TaxID=360412 RepID=A0A0S7BHF0_9CHLR|nr:tetratricopeptide repeat protein [Longilinea arvoryzae]GAP14035.1 protein containg FOG: TPR repeat [Longilinea arvoryzae]
MNKRRHRTNPVTIVLFFLAVGALIYVNQVIVPSTTPLFIPTATPTRAPETYIADAESLVSEGKISQAITAYKDAVQADPRNAGVKVSLAELEAMNGSYADAILHTEDALLLDTNNAMAHAVRGWALGLSGDYLASQTALKQAIEIDPNNPIPYAYLAEVLARMQQDGKGSMGTLDEAIEYSRKARDLGPDLLETHRARGIILELTGENADAIQEFEAAIAINPNIAELHIMLGRNYVAIGNDPAAEEQYYKANSLNPSDPWPDVYMSRLYLRTGDYVKAIQFAEQAVENDPSNSYFYINLGTMYYKNLMYPDSIKAFRLGLRGGTTEDGVELPGAALSGDNVDAYYFYGLALARNGECNEAVEISQMLQQTVPNDDIAMYNAQEMINICTGQSATETVATETITPEENSGVTDTPQP